MARTRHLCDKVLLTAYTSPTVLLAAVALVLCFAALNIGPRFGRFIESVSPLAFSVYLIHAHPLIWEHWLAGRFAFLADKPPILQASGVLGVCHLPRLLSGGRPAGRLIPLVPRQSVFPVGGGSRIGPTPTPT